MNRNGRRPLSCRFPQIRIYRCVSVWYWISWPSSSVPCPLFCTSRYARGTPQGGGELALTRSHPLLPEVPPSRSPLLTLQPLSHPGCSVCGLVFEGSYAALPGNWGCRGYIEICRDIVPVLRQKCCSLASQLVFSPLLRGGKTRSGSPEG